MARSGVARHDPAADLQALLEALPDAVVSVRADGRIALVNAETERIFGYHRDELLGQPVEVLVPEVARGMHARHRQEYLADPSPRPMGGRRQLTARRQDGSEFPADISLSSFSTEDGPVVAAVIRDVTERLEVQAERERLRAYAERERLETRRQQADRLESLGDLAGGVAHDFNNLLSVIVNYAAFVAEDVEGAAATDPDRWRSVIGDVEQIRLATERGMQLTRQLLVFGRRNVVRPQVLYLNSVVDDAAERLRETLGDRIRLVTALAPRLWPVKADPGQIGQVLANLALNARDAMPERGTLTIDTANVVVGEEEVGGDTGLVPGHYVRLRVHDTGAGMHREALTRAFDPFFTTKPKGQGTGLGLATVYGIVRQAGGTAHIDSESGLGTTVSVLLPVTDEVPAEAEAPVTEALSGRGETVLVIEDETAIRDSVESMLRRGGYRVLTARTGLEALERAARYDGEIHLLLSDVVMPTMLGTDVSERIRALRPTIRVLFMSGYARPVLAGSGTLAPGVPLLEKPFSESVLLGAVRQVLAPAG